MVLQASWICLIAAGRSMKHPDQLKLKFQLRYALDSRVSLPAPKGNAHVAELVDALDSGSSE